MSTCDEGTDTCVGICPPTLQFSCRGADRSALQIKNDADDSRDKFTWKWSKGAATTIEDFADPRTSATYALCIYAAGNSVGEIQVPPSSIYWAPLGSKGFVYRDVAGLQDGAQKIALKSGESGRAKIQLKGRGVGLPDPLTGNSLPLPITVQMVNADSGLCWQSVFTHATKNEFKQFKAKTP